MPMNEIKKAINVTGATICLGPGFESEFSNDTDWLRQYFIPADTKLRGYLIEGDASYPTKIWEQMTADRPTNHVDTFYRLVWESD